MACKTVGGKTCHSIADTQVVDVFTHPGNDTGKFKTEIRTGKTVFHSIIGQQAHGEHDVTEVEPHCHDASFDLTGSEGMSRIRLPAQIVQPARYGKIQTAALCRCGGAAMMIPAVDPEHITGLGSQQHFVIFSGSKELHLKALADIRTAICFRDIHKRAVQPPVFLHDDAPQAGNGTLGRIRRMAVRQSGGQ